MFDYLIFNNAATSVANQKCQKTHLYPYQLLQLCTIYTDSNIPDDEAPDWSDDEEGADEEDSDVSNLLLSRIYEVLYGSRQIWLGTVFRPTVVCCPTPNRLRFC